MKNVVITGSTRGIGLCMTIEFLKAGCNVTISGRNEKPIETVRQSLSVGSGKALSERTIVEQVCYIPCDVRYHEEIENLWQESVERWGRVDIWINNAGQNVPHEYTCDTEACFVDAVIDTNIKGMIFGTQVAAKNMLVQGSGQIWNMEGLGSNNMIQRKTILYGTTKHALTYFTRGMAKELAGTPVLAGRLSPGMMLTDFITKTPEGEPSAVAQDPAFRKIFNLLADRPETVAAFFIPRILANTKQNAQIQWLTNAKVMLRFAAAPFNKRKLLDD